ncbi:MAG: TetR/AcrR family transcriptional regulator [Clostridia bacterium]
MSKDTYHNLPKGKRDMVLNVAIDEFHEHGYASFSISRMVEKAGIAKGSFYQYFNGKEDLFRLVMDTAAEKKVAYLKELGIHAGPIPLFDLLRVLFLGGLSFQKENPKLSAIIDSFMQTADLSLKKKILGDNVEKSNAFLRDLLQDAIKRKEIRANLDVPYTAHLLTGLSISLSDYMRERTKDMGRIDEAMYRRLVDTTLLFLRQGLT